MNPVFQQAASSAGLGWILGINTILFMGVFIGWSLYLWAPSRKQELDATGRLPLEEK